MVELFCRCGVQCLESFLTNNKNMTYYYYSVSQNFLILVSAS